MWKERDLSSLACRQIDGCCRSDRYEGYADASIVCSQWDGEKWAACRCLILDGDRVQRKGEQLRRNRASGTCSNVSNETRDVHSPMKWDGRGLERMREILSRVKILSTFQDHVSVTEMGNLTPIGQHFEAKVPIRIQFRHAFVCWFFQIASKLEPENVVVNSCELDTSSMHKTSLR